MKILRPLMVLFLITFLLLISDIIVNAQIHYDNTGRIGIGTDTPRNPLGIRASGDWGELISFEDPTGIKMAYESKFI